MAAQNPPGWLQNAGATHTAAQMRTYISVFLGSASSAGSLVAAGGVSAYLGNKLQVTQTASPSMAIIVKSGVCWIPGSESSTQGAYGALNDADVTIAVTANGSGLARIDSVFFKVQDSQYSGSTDACSLVVVAGTPSGSPAPPTAPANAIRLANIAVANGASSIVDANITDQRVFISAAGIPDVQVFTSSGTWTKPSNARFSYIRAQAGGGAGGGSAAPAGTNHTHGGGGGGGGYAESWLDASTLTSTVTVTVGAGGTGVSAGTGNTGGTSSFGAYVSATGGVGGQAEATSSSTTCALGGAGGAGTAGQIQTVGTVGGFGVGAGATLAQGGQGGASYMGGGGKGGDRTSNTGQNHGGSAGQNYGGGGGGGATSGSGAATSGGAGAPGIVIVITFF